MFQPSYRHGRLIWAHLRSSQTGKRQAHPAIILDRTSDIIQPEHFDPRRGDNMVCVVGVSTKYSAHDLPFIRLPFSPRGHATTKLRQDCAAIIGWYHRIFIPDNVIGFGGDVPARQMVQIDRAVYEDLVRNLAHGFDDLRAVLQHVLGLG